MLLPGATIQQYRVLRKIGQGGTATVYAVEHMVLGTHHALKVPEPIDAHAIERVVREGEVQAALDAPHVLGVTEVVDVDGRPALVLPLVQGCTLASLIARRRLDEREVAGIALPMLSGIGSAHAANIVHGDLKPANVLLEVERGHVHVRVADFGLASLASREATPDHFGGTPAYASPELLLGRPASPQSDLYAVGIMLVELLTGQRPAPQSDAVPPAGAVPEAWQPIVAQLLDETPETRFATADDVREAIRASVADIDELLAGSALGQAVLGATRLAGAPSPAAVPHRLPTERTALSVPPEALRRLSEAVDSAESRLVWVTGDGFPLAVRFAWTELAAFPGGVWFVDLTDADTPLQAIDRTARELGVGLQSADPALQLSHALVGRGRVLLVLDEVPEGIVDLLHEWLERAPELSIVALTSGVPATAPGDVDIAHPIQNEVELHDLLPADRRVLAHLLPFRGGFTPATAAAVLGPLTPSDAFASLLDRGHLVSDNGERLRVGSNVASALVEQANELAPEATIHHGRVFAAVGSDPELNRDEHENLVVACTSAVERGDGAVAIATLLGASAWWTTDGVAALGEPLAAQVQAMPKLLASDRARATLTRGRLAERLGRPEDAQRHYEAAIAEAESVDDLFVQTRAWHRLGVYGLPDDPDARTRALDRALDGARELGDRLFESRILADLAMQSESIAPTAGGGVTRLEEALHIAMAHRSSHLATTALLRAEVLAELGRHHARTGRLRRAIEHIEAAIGALREAPPSGGRDRRVGEHLAELADLRIGWHSRPPVRPDARVQARALADYTEALCLVRAQGIRVAEASLLVRLGWLHGRRGDPQKAHDHYETAHALLRQLGDRAAEARVLDLLGEADLHLDEPTRARARLEAAVEAAQSVGDEATTGHSLRVLAQLDARDGNLEAAEARLEASIAHQTAAGDERGASLARTRLGALMRDVGRLDEARVHLEAALSDPGAADWEEHVGSTIAELALLGALEGRFGKAQARLDEALAALPLDDGALRAGVEVLRARVFVEMELLNLARGALAAARRLRPDSDRDVLHAIETTEASLAD